MRHTRFPAIAVSVLCVLHCAVLRAADWPQYRGPNQDGCSPENVTPGWPAGGPKVVWKVPTPNGFGSFAVAAGKAFIQVSRDVDGAPKEVCLALDAATGKELWFADVGVGKYDGSGNAGARGNDGGDGPRSTPTVSDGMVYVFTPDLVLYCLNIETGKPAWTKNLIKEHAGRNIGWKNAASPVVDGDLVFVGGGGPGQSLLAFNKKTGDVVWKAHTETITHATPVAAAILGERQVIFFVQSGLLAVSAKDGKALWRFPYKFNVSTAIFPVVSGDIVYCSAGYSVGGGACRITKEGDGFKATELYKNNQAATNHWSTPVCKDGHLYGMFSFKQWATGPLKCVELATGKVKWEQAGFGAGQAILVKDTVVALADDGQVVLVEAKPDAYKEVARFKAVTGKCWSTPAFADGRLYVRSTKEGACLDASGK
ncbi:MAG: PQQ-like beta-propeller repeat protein [Planctomycetota bacterium]|nr:PQQ-like beta-propeller repeat protein [Planctomycetota bacterium]